jgi:hypothetical protein
LTGRLVRSSVRNSAYRCEPGPDAQLEPIDGYGFFISDYHATRAHYTGLPSVIFTSPQLASAVRPKARAGDRASVRVPDPWPRRGVSALADHATSAVKLIAATYTSRAVAIVQVGESPSRGCTVRKPRRARREPMGA